MVSMPPLGIERGIITPRCEVLGAAYTILESSVDISTKRDVGLYLTKECVGQPDNGWGVLKVIVVNSIYIQIWIKDGYQTNDICYRKGTSTTWSSWYKLNMTVLT